MASSRRYFETDLSQSRLERRRSRGESAEGGGAPGGAGCSGTAHFADLRDRTSGLPRSGVVPEPGGGSGNGVVPDAVADPNRPGGAGTRTRAHSAQRTADHRYRYPVLCRGHREHRATGDSASADGGAALRAGAAGGTGARPAAPGDASQRAPDAGMRADGRGPANTLTWESTAS